MGKISLLGEEISVDFKFKLTLASLCNIPLGWVSKHGLNRKNNTGLNDNIVRQRAPHILLPMRQQNTDKNVTDIFLAILATLVSLTFPKAEKLSLKL